MTKDEKQFLKAYRDMKKLYPNGELILCNPKTYFGYELGIGKRIIVKTEEANND